MKNGTVRRVRGHYGSVKGMNWLGLQAVEDPISALGHTLKSSAICISNV